MNLEPQIITIKNQLAAADAECARAQYGLPSTYPLPLIRAAHCTRCNSETLASATPAYAYTPLGTEKWYCPACHPEVCELKNTLGLLTQQQAANIARLVDLRVYRKTRASETMSQIAPRFRNSWYRTFRPQNETQATASAQLRKWIATDSARERFPFFVLTGPVGVGKTHLLVSAWRQWSREKGIATLANEVDFVTRWQASHDAYDPSNKTATHKTTPTGLIDAAATASLLIFDDIGKAKLTDAWAKAIFTVMNHRYNQNLPTLISANYVGRQLSDRVGEAVADRVTSGLVFGIEGQSLRRAI